MSIFETEKERQTRELQEAREAGQKDAGKFWDEFAKPIPHVNSGLAPKRNSEEYDNRLRDSYAKGIKSSGGFWENTKAKPKSTNFQISTSKSRGNPSSPIQTSSRHASSDTAILTPLIVGLLVLILILALFSGSYITRTYRLTYIDMSIGGSPAPESKVIKLTNTVFFYHWLYCVEDAPGFGIAYFWCNRRVEGTRYYYDKFSQFSDQKVTALYSSIRPKLDKRIMVSKGQCASARGKIVTSASVHCFHFNWFYDGLIAKGYLDMDNLLVNIERLWQPGWPYFLHPGTHYTITGYLVDRR